MLVLVLCRCAAVPLCRGLCRYWAVAAPAYACVCLLFMPVFYNALNLMRTPSLDSYDCFTGTAPALPPSSSPPPPSSI